MMMLPFVTKPKSTTTDEIVDIGNDSIGVLKVLKKGGLSYNETQLFNKAIDKVSGKFERKPSESNFQLLLDTVTIAFKERVQQFDEKNKPILKDDKPVFGCENWTLENTIEFYDDNRGIYNLLYEFMSSEKNGWEVKFETKIEGRDADLIAQSYGDENGLIYASDGKDWFIFKDKEDVPNDYFIPGEEKVINKGKAKK